MTVVAIELSKLEQRVAYLLERAAHEGTPVDEARTSAVIAAKKIKEHGFSVIDLKEYDAWWKEQLQEALQKSKPDIASELLLRGQIDTLQKRLADTRQQAERSEHELELCRLTRDRYMEDVARLQKRSTVDPTELARLEKKIKDLTFRMTVAQANARTCENLRVEDLAYYEKKLAAPVTQDPRHFLLAGLLAGSVITLVGGLVIKKVMSKTPEQLESAGRIAGT